MRWLAFIGKDQTGQPYVDVVYEGEILVTFGGFRSSQDAYQFCKAHLLRPQLAH